MSAINQSNILWIGVDQMRADALGYNGNSICQTPHLDQLAQDGINFRRAYTPCTLCTPARASMLTGLHAFTHGMGTNCDLYHSLAAELPHPDQLLHRQLLKIGYRCGFTGKWHVGTELGPVDYSFEGMNLPGYGDLRQYPAYQDYLKENNLSFGPIRNPIYGNLKEKTLIAGEWNGPLESTTTHFLTNYTMHLLDEFAESRVNTGQPFFLTCQYWAPHGPYLPSPEFVGRHNRDNIPEWINFRDDYHGKPESLGRFRRDFFPDLPTDWSGWQEMVGLAYDYNAQVDAEIGRLLAHLDRLGLSDNTIVFFTSDHGDMTGSHGGLVDKGYMYEETQRVPLIVRLPDSDTPGLIRDELVYNMDIMPTIFDLIGQELANQIDGQSLRPYLTGDPGGESGRDAIYMEFHGIRCLHTQRGLVTQNGFKYIFNPLHEDELYDLINDPGELRNLLDDPAYRSQREKCRQEIVQAAVASHDPVQNYMAKLFGDYDNLAAQPDPSTAYHIEDERT
jgi:arylsulfatase A-like enzyme